MSIASICWSRLTASFRACVLLGVFSSTLLALDLRAPLGELIFTAGYGQSTVTAITENPDGTISLEAEQTGRLTHIGLFRATFSYLATIDYNTGTTLITGDGTITSAKGDQLNVDVTIVEVGVDYPRPYTGLLTVTGGTGRFAGASGALEITGLDEESLTDSFTLAGVISTLGKTK
jgi:hypothetical protein